jgi:hypothetical protein
MKSANRCRFQPIELDRPRHLAAAIACARATTAVGDP